MSHLAINGAPTPAALTQASNNPVLSKTDEKTKQVSQGFFTSLIKFIGTLILAVTFPVSLPILYIAGKVKDLLSSSKSTPKQVELKTQHLENVACKSPGSLGSQDDQEQLLEAKRNQETAIIHPAPLALAPSSTLVPEEENPFAIHPFVGANLEGEVDKAPASPVTQSPISSVATDEDLEEPTESQENENVTIASQNSTVKESFRNKAFASISVAAVLAGVTYSACAENSFSSMLAAYLREKAMA